MILAAIARRDGYRRLERARGEQCEGSEDCREFGVACVIVLQTEDEDPNMIVPENRCHTRVKKEKESHETGKVSFR